MAAYVDDLRAWPLAAYRGDRAAFRVGARNGHRWCHLWADTKDELKRFGKLLALKAEWAHRSRRGLLHFNLTPGRREQAVAMGAQELTRRQVVAVLARLRQGRVVEC